YEDTLDNIVRLAVRDLADFCSVDVVEPDGRIRRLKVMSRDPSKTWVSDLFRQASIDQPYPYFIRAVLENMRPVLIEQATPAMISSIFTNERGFPSFRNADFGSLIAVPLMVRGKLVGVIALMSGSRSRAYGLPDVRLAEELAQRAAFSIE